MGELRVGTASWTDRTLVRETDWYPSRSMSAEQRLRHYASIFPLVEVDATYYYPPTQELAALWIQRTPPGFRFDVKAYSLLTHHPTDPRSLWPQVATQVDASRKRVYLSHLPPAAVDVAFERFAEALLPLHSAGKLGAVFFQFPEWFTPRRENRSYLESLAERLPEYQVAVEFRYGGWMDEASRDRTLHLLERHGLAYVAVDEPQGFRSSVPPVVAATADLGVLRMHGHNRDTWEAKGLTPAERFAYLYSDDELRAWVPEVERLANETRQTHVVFNNCYRDYGVRNARQLGELLGTGLSENVEG